MYKVFHNRRVIILSGHDNNPGDSEWADVIITITEMGLLPKLVFDFLAGESESIRIQSENELVLLGGFKKLFHFIRAAGGIVYKKGEVLFIYRNGRWDLPKGKVEKGETTEEAAVREVMEECGLPAVKIRGFLNTTYHVYKAEYPDGKGEWILKETIWYEMNYEADTLPEPETDEGITAVKWYNPDNLEPVMLNTWDSLVPVIKSISGSASSD